MSDVLSCCTPCRKIEVVNVPGSEGLDGTDGTNGVDAFTRTTADFALPNDGDTTAPVPVENSTWMVIGQVVIVGVGWDGTGNGPAHFKVASIPSSTSVTLTKLTNIDDIVPPATITSGSTVSPSA